MIFTKKNKLARKNPVFARCYSSLKDTYKLAKTECLIIELFNSVDILNTYKRVCESLQHTTYNNYPAIIFYSIQIKSIENIEMRKRNNYFLLITKKVLRFFLMKSNYKLLNGKAFNPFSDGFNYEIYSTRTINHGYVNQVLNYVLSLNKIKKIESKPTKININYEKDLMLLINKINSDVVFYEGFLIVSGDRVYLRFEFLIKHKKNDAIKAMAMLKLFLNSDLSNGIEIKTLTHNNEQTPAIELSKNFLELVTQ